MGSEISIHLNSRITIKELVQFKHNSEHSQSVQNDASKAHLDDIVYRVIDNEYSIIELVKIITILFYIHYICYIYIFILKLR